MPAYPKTFKITKAQAALFRKKLQRAIAWIKQEYGLTSTNAIAAFCGENPWFVKNLIYAKPRQFQAGPPLGRFYRFCRTFRLRLEYFADPAITVDGSMCLEDDPLILQFQAKYLASGDIQYLHMAGCLVLNTLSKADVKGSLLINDYAAVITIDTGPKAGLLLIVKTDEEGLFTLSYSGQGDQEFGNVVLTDGVLTGLHEQFNLLDNGID